MKHSKVLGLKWKILTISSCCFPSQVKENSLGFHVNSNSKKEFLIPITSQPKAPRSQRREPKEQACSCLRQKGIWGLTGGGFFGRLGGGGGTSSVETGEKKVSLDSFFWKGFIAGSLLSLSLQAFGFGKHLGQLPAYCEKWNWLGGEKGWL